MSADSKGDHWSNTVGTSRMLEVNLAEVLPAYEEPEQCPEWQWVANRASFAHTENGSEPGVWEFIVRTTKGGEERCEIPQALRPFFAMAQAQGFDRICLHQGG